MWSSSVVDSVWTPPVEESVGTSGPVWDYVDIDWTAEATHDFTTGGGAETFTMSNGKTVIAAGLTQATQLKNFSGVGLKLQCNGGGGISGATFNYPHFTLKPSDFFPTLNTRDLIAVQHRIVHARSGSSGFFASYTFFGAASYDQDRVYTVAAEVNGTKLSTARRTIAGSDSSDSTDSSTWGDDSLRQLAIFGNMGLVDAHYQTWPGADVTPDDSGFTYIPCGSLQASTWPLTSRYNVATDVVGLALGCSGDYTGTIITVKKTRILRVDMTAVV